MYSEIELLPSDKTSLLEQQQTAQATLAPHLLLLQFFVSHFKAIWLGNVQTRRLFGRLIDRTTIGLQRTNGHPLARELHFRIILFGLRILRDSHPPDTVASWKLRDQILSAALSWFKHPPRSVFPTHGFGNCVL